ncbi:MAG: hypothetical protein K2M17_01590 [Bacilli bacterium]|nr:hypothetical protein [Bacilli bacterium]
MFTQVYTVMGSPTKDGHTLIDETTIEFIAALHSMNPKEDFSQQPSFVEEESTQETVCATDIRSFEAKTFEENVIFLFNECVARSSASQDDTDNIHCNIARISLNFSKTKIDYYRGFIGYLLSQLTSIETADGLSTLASGEKWNRSMQSLSFLIALATTAQFLQYDNALDESYKKSSILQRGKRKMR